MIYLCDISNIEIDKLNYKSVESYVGHLLLKYAFNIVGINLDRHEITYNENGKPYIKDIKYHFNISHSKNLISLIISDKECGIDIQIFDGTRNFDKIVDKYFSIDDKNVYYNLQGENRKKFFYTIWVQIETHVKKLGSNLMMAKGLEYKNFNVRNLKDRESNQYYLSSTINENIIEVNYNDLI